MGLTTGLAPRAIPSLNASKTIISGAKFGWNAMVDVAMWPGSSKIGRVEDEDQLEWENWMKMSRNQTERYMRLIGKWKLTTLKYQ